MYIPPRRLLALIDDPRLPVRDTALRALGRLDGNEGVSALIQVMDDDRARIAIYALRHALLQMPADQTLNLLNQISLKKVTVAKEVIRLIGELRQQKLRSKSYWKSKSAIFIGMLVWRSFVVYGSIIGKKHGQSSQQLQRIPIRHSGTTAGRTRAPNRLLVRVQSFNC